MFTRSSHLFKNSIQRLKFNRNFSVNVPSISKKICFLGGGQMAEAIIGSICVSNKVQNPKDCVVFDTNNQRLEYLQEKYGITTSKCSQDAVDNAELIMLCVKPQHVEYVSKNLKINPSSLILSIVAGLTLSEMEKYFHSSNLIRSMPNTPTMVMEGITVWMATENADKEKVEKVKQLLNCFGDDIQVHDENYIDMATAVSGSGPAYVFLTMEAMIDAAVHLGFPRDMAQKLVISTIRGTSTYAQQSSKHVATLRNNVTSPGGTTASAVYELEKGGYRTVISDAIWAAYRRTLELGHKNSNVGPGRSR